MKKTIILIFGITMVLVNSSCKPQYSVTELNNNFTAEQITDLNTITEFFKKEMCLYTDTEFENCYTQIPHEYLQATGTQFWLNIDFERQKELYSQISQSTFNEIWMFCKAVNFETKEESKSICPVYNGKYQKFLADLSKRNERIAIYLRKIQGSGDFNGFDIRFREVLTKKSSFDLKDPNIQLILAIHYLSLNDREKRIEKWE